LNSDQLNNLLFELHHCTVCPRNCQVDRIKGKAGYCRSDAGFNVASVCIHHGEEPAISGIKGICNIFFTNCNLQCIYCQNYQISNNHLIHKTIGNSARNSNLDVLNEILDTITNILDQGVRSVGFVSPSHFVPQVKVIIQAIEQRGYKPIWVYNSNGYENITTLQTLEGIIDVYLPDFKYSDHELSRKYSDAGNYPDIALKAVKEMVRQKGTVLHLDEDGQAESGIIVRHLVLPGHIDNSLNVIKILAEEISPRLHISLMSQYYPTRIVDKHEFLGKKLTDQEYKTVTDLMEELGMNHGWIQEFESSDFYRPDFNQSHPFEDQRS